MEHRYRTGDHLDELHIVLDNDERSPGVDGTEQRNRAFHFIRAHARGRLIEQYEFRILRDHHTDLDPLSLTVRKLAHRAAGNRLEAEVGQQRICQHGGRAGAGPVVRRDPEMLVDGQAVPDAGYLILDADAESCDPVLGLASNVAPLEQNSTACWAQLAGEHFEERALAGAVWSNQAAQLTAPQP